MIYYVYGYLDKHIKLVEFLLGVAYNYTYASLYTIKLS